MVGAICGTSINDIPRISPRSIFNSTVLTCCARDLTDRSQMNPPSSQSQSVPRLHVTAHLPPTISFSSAEEPQLEVRMTLEYSQPVIFVLKKSHLWPHHHYTALILHNASSGRQEYIPRIDAAFRSPTIPPVDAEHRKEFVGLRPGQTEVIAVSFRPYDEPYDWERM